jgi:hypothetical protein
MPVEEVKRLGRSTQGVIVMRLRGDDERVSALAPVVESESNGDAEEPAAAEAAEVGEVAEPPAEEAETSD